jgi:hypothetical protein
VDRQASLNNNSLNDSDTYLPAVFPNRKDSADLVLWTDSAVVVIWAVVMIWVVVMVMRGGQDMRGGHGHGMGGDAPETRGYGYDMRGRDYEWSAGDRDKMDYAPRVVGCPDEGVLPPHIYRDFEGLYGQPLPRCYPVSASNLRHRLESWIETLELTDEVVPFEDDERAVSDLLRIVKGPLHI